MKKSDLKHGMWVELGDGDLLMVSIQPDTEILIINKNTWMCLSEYTEDLRHITNVQRNRIYDIIKVYEINNHSYLNLGLKELIWERKEEKKISDFTNEELINEFQKRISNKRIKLDFDEFP